MSTKPIFLPDLSSVVKLTAPVPPMVRFAGEFAAIVTGVSFSKMVGRGVLMFADDPKAATKEGRDWRHYWDGSDGSPSVAWAMMFADKSMPFDDEHQQIRDLLLAHERFFFARESKKLVPMRRNIEVLWPHVQSGALLEHWRKTKAIDVWATGERMGELLKKARLKPPAWGQGHE